MALPIIPIATVVLQGYKIIRDGSDDLKALKRIPSIVRDTNKTRFSRVLAVADIAATASLTILALRGLRKGKKS